MIRGDTLQVLGLYSPTSIPQYLVIDFLRVSSGSHELDQWFRQALKQAEKPEQLAEGDAVDIADDDPMRPCSSSDYGFQTMGILCSVKPAIEPREDDSLLNPPITEVLLYGCRVDDMERHGDERHRDGWADMVRLDGDEPLPDRREGGGSMVMALYAVSISSGLLYKPIKTDPMFINNPDQSKALLSTAQTTQKHERLSQLFDEATQRRKKPRLSDGRERSASRASSIMTSPMLPQDGFPVDNIIGSKGPANDISMTGMQATMRVPPSRSNSASIANEARPASRRGNLERTSTLLSQSFTADTALEQQIETRNKELISRTVLVGMKSYGLSSYKGSGKKTQTNVTGAESQGVDSPDVAADVATESQDIAGDGRDGEYKSVYHQTNKATCFAFRNGMGSMMLRPESIRDVVDRQLAIFCTEPP